jgi:four helix bundle protein
VGDYEELITYRLAAEIGDDLRRRIFNWSWIDQRSVGLQLLRAVDSIGANIAEAGGRWHRADERRILYIARGSFYEARHWITRAIARDLLPSELRHSLDDLGRALNGQIRANEKRLTTND